MKPPGARFRPHERLKDARQFQQVFRRKRSAGDAHLVVYGLENQRDYSRLGLSISKRKVGSAVRRNRVKRLIREAFRRSKMDLPRGLDLIVIARGPELGYDQVRESLVKLARAVQRRLDRDRQRSASKAEPTAPTRPVEGSTPCS